MSSILSNEGGKIEVRGRRVTARRRYSSFFIFVLGCGGGGRGRGEDGSFCPSPFTPATFFCWLVFSFSFFASSITTAAAAITCAFSVAPSSTAGFGRTTPAGYRGTSSLDSSSSSFSSFVFPSFCSSSFLFLGDEGGFVAAPPFFFGDGGDVVANAPFFFRDEGVLAVDAPFFGEEGGFVADASIFTGSCASSVFFSFLPLH
mmetsp:Transcript_21748/g.64047  ORF Transcript_21748/g.64047 Transcript_21748/m.64047 type:complete len:202 (+) Transcript_21748:6229-6834(+)